jgi:hypothetical protein
MLLNETNYSDAAAKPNDENRWKSVELLVANFASARIATAAIMQSTSEPRRRPVPLKSCAA